MQVDATSDGIVSRPDNRNLKRLEQYDLEIEAARQAVIAAEGRGKGELSRIICAAVFMVEISSRNRSHGTDSSAANGRTVSMGPDLGVIGTSPESVWRQFASQPEKQSRERISQYGKAIKVAHGFYQQGTMQPAKLLKRVTDGGGVKGLIKISRRIKPVTGP